MRSLTPTCKNICLFNTNKAWGGGEKWHYNTAKYLRSQGYNVYIITHTSSKLGDKLKKSNFEITTIPVGKLSFLNPLKKRKLRSLFTSWQLDSIILNLPQDAKLAGSVGHSLNIKKIIYRRGMNHPIKASKINKLVYTEYITDFIANSREVKKSIHQNIKELKSKISIIFNGVNLHEIPRAKVEQEKIVIGNLGRLVEQKGQKYLIDIAKELKQTDLNFEILIAGTGPLKTQLIELIEAQELTKEIKLIGHTNTEDFFNRVDIFVFTSLFEGLSNALLEAQLYQKPTIAFNTASNYEVITHGYNGILISPFNTNLMAKALYTLSKSNKMKDTFKENGLDLLHAKFNQKRMNIKLEELLQR